MGSFIGKHWKGLLGLVVGVPVILAVLITLVVSGTKGQAIYDRNHPATTPAANTGGTVPGGTASGAATSGTGATPQSLPKTLPTTIPDVSKAEQQLAATRTCGTAVRGWFQATARPQLKVVASDVSKARLKADLHQSEKTLNAPTGAVTQLNGDLVKAEGTLTSVPACARPLRNILTVALGDYVNGARALGPNGQGATVAASDFHAGDHYLLGQAISWLKSTYGSYKAGFKLTSAVQGESPASTTMALAA